LAWRGKEEDDATLPPESKPIGNVEHIVVSSWDGYVETNDLPPPLNTERSRNFAATESPRRKWHHNLILTTSAIVTFLNQILGNQA